MGELIAALQRLQEIELELGRLRRQEERKAQKIRTAERQVRRIDDELAELRMNCERRRSELDQLDREVKAREASILKHREELLKARTNKDYAAILTAINTEKADSAKIEKAALEKLAEFERVQEEVNAHTQRQESAQQRTAAAQQALEKHREKTADERHELEEQRDAATADLPATILATFTRVASRHDGEALAEIMRLHPKREEYACGGCNMQVPLDCVNAARSMDEIRLCPTCGRILHLPTPAATGT
jgi:predicted  nucleic acid-binding Zn-ribbon protein